MPPKLQRIPKPQDTISTPPIVKPLPPVPKPDLPKLTPRPGLATVPKFVKINNLPEQNTEQKSLVGSVTTWFPPSSTIQVANDTTRINNGEIHSPPRPQYVEILGNKKYLIVPKHNILSVSPAVASVNNKSEDFVSTPDLLNVGSDHVDEIIAEAAKIPPSPRLSTEDIKVEPQSPTQINRSDDNLPEPMEVDTPPPDPMDIDPPDVVPQKAETENPTPIVPDDDVNVETTNEVVESEETKEEIAPLPTSPKNEDSVTNLQEDHEQDSASSDQE